MKGLSNLKVICQLIQYQYKQYKLSARWTMPVIALIAILFAMYSVTPVFVVNSFSIMSLLLFLIMVWIGVTNWQIEPEVSEQIIILRVQSERKYYISQVLFMGIMSFVVTAISIGVPVLDNLIRKNGVFGRKVLWLDIMGGFLLMFSCAFTGAMVGGLFHPRIIKERAVGIGAAFFVALLAVVRSGVIDEFPASKYILWCVPPVSDVVSWFSNEEYFDIGRIFIAFGLLMMYGIVLAVVRIEISRIRKF